MVEQIITKIERAIDIEIESIKTFRANLDSKNIEIAVEEIFQSTGKLVLSGVGKSGDIAKKISSTLSSTGTPSFFLHPTDAAHGDAGIVQKGDVLLAIGKSGESDELVFLIPTFKKIGVKIISITANPKSRLAKSSDIHIFTPILKEACPLDLAPTSSTTIALILGDAIAMALMEMKKFKENDFALYHPSGRLGRRLSLSVDDVMRKGNENSTIKANQKLNEILTEITSKLVGAVSVIDENNHLLGFITDFDIRRLLKENKLTNDKTASDIMNTKPTHFRIGEKAYDVLLAMEERDRPISAAPILDTEEKVVGIISLHDLLQKGLK
ncbi:MAG: KpsF/GutQ family sugar-phosphate isomerase [Leptospiraceae bacterium]|nr:KpsF/GutQ family sugar-phosphate isomerase [Leptospiraceae bacterium]MCK6381963.1 KpsF/GutQ family sugar-phosphate isomerase [Leptospiraceae bacterium]NUM40301.1 KpsF/GutQ family sugar-phosphate isomerase [Leptospiraceae bacterium]